MGKKRETMNCTQIFLKLFGTTELFGINLGFWIAMGICLLVVIGMNLVFWGMKPVGKKKKQGGRYEKRKTF